MIFEVNSIKVPSGPNSSRPSASIWSINRLVQFGLPVRGPVLLLYAVTFVFGVFAFVVSRTVDWSAYLVAGVAFGASVLGLIALERRAGHHLVAGFEPQGESA